MAKRKKKNEMDIPESENLFTKKQMEYLARAAKMIKWEVDIQFAQINVPPQDMNEAEQDLSVRHLVTEFGFVVQQSIVCPPAKNLFNPALKERATPEDPAEKSFVSIGDKFAVYDFKGTHLMDYECTHLSPNGDVNMKAIGQMSVAVPFSVKVIEEMVKRRAWRRI